MEQTKDKIDYSTFDGSIAQLAARRTEQIQQLIEELNDAWAQLFQGVAVKPEEGRSDKALDEMLVKWAGDLKQNVSVTPLTMEEHELLSYTLAERKLSEVDFATMAIRHKLRAIHGLADLHDDRRALEFPKQ